MERYTWELIHTFPKNFSEKLIKENWTKILKSVRLFCFLRDEQSLLLAPIFLVNTIKSSNKKTITKEKM